MWSTADFHDSRPHIALDLCEARPTQPIRELISRPVVRGQYGVFEGFDLVAVEEPDDQRSAQLHHSPQLTEHKVELGRSHVNERVPREDAGD